jgi:hypothetical protein
MWKRSASSTRKGESAEGVVGERDVEGPRGDNADVCEVEEQTEQRGPDG